MVGATSAVEERISSAASSELFSCLEDTVDWMLTDLQLQHRIADHCPRRSWDEAVPRHYWSHRVLCWVRLPSFLKQIESTLMS